MVLINIDWIGGGGYWIIAMNLRLPGAPIGNHTSALLLYFLVRRRCVAKSESLARRVELVGNRLARMREPHYVLLRYLIGFLDQCATHALTRTYARTRRLEYSKLHSLQYEYIGLCL